MKKLLLQISILILTVTGSYAQQENALYFDNVDDNITVPAASSLIANSSQISMTCWVYPENSSLPFPDYDGFGGFRNDASGDFYLVQITPAKVEGRFRNNLGTAFTVNDSTLQLNTWQHYALTYDGSYLRIYRNGVMRDSIAASGKITNTNQDFYIGDLVFSFNNFYLKGKMDEVSLWNKGLTASEVNCIYKSYINPSSTGLLLYYKFNQGIAGATNTGQDTLYPQAGSLKGILNNFGLTGLLSNWVGGVQNYGSILNNTICPGQTVSFGTQTLTTPGQYYETYTGSSGCDSIVKMNLDPAVDTGVTQSGYTLTSVQSGAVYQWIDCNNGGAPVTGEVSQSFSPSVDGDYAVAVTINSCTDTSACYTVIGIGIKETNALYDVRILSNPVHENLSFINLKQKSRMEIFDLAGQKVFHGQVNENQKTDVSFIPKGIYSVKLISKNGETNLRMIKN